MAGRDFWGVAAALGARVAVAGAVTLAPIENVQLGFEPAPRTSALVARVPGATITLADGGAARLTIGGATLSMYVVGGRPAAGVPEDIQAGVSHYLIGNDPAAWLRDVPRYARVTFADVLPGIDLVYHGHGRNLEYDVIVHSGADPGAFALAIEGADDAFIDAAGNAVLCVAGAELLVRAPIAWQSPAEPVCARLMLGGSTPSRELTLAMGPYDPTRPLVVDPVLAFSTYVGGSGSDEARGVAVDAAGAIYVVGSTASPDFPLAGPLQPALRGNRDVFLTKMAANGGALVYSTYLGGSDADDGYDVSVDATGAVTVVGGTFSADFPTVSALQPGSAGSSDAFICRLDATGSTLLWSTYLGGSGDDWAAAVDVDGQGATYVAGRAQYSPTFPTVPSPGECDGVDAFVAKLAPGGQSVDYTRCYGGDTAATCDPFNESCMSYWADDVQADALGRAWSAGTIQGDSIDGSFGSLLISSFEPTGGRTDSYSIDQPVLWGSGIALDGGKVYATTYRGDVRVDATRVSFPGVVLRSIAADGARTLTVAGEQGSDVFVATLDRSLRPITTLTLGGGGTERAVGVAATSAARVIVGATTSTDFPVVAAYQPLSAGGQDAFVTRFFECFTVDPRVLPDGFVGVAYAQTLAGSGGTPPYTFAAVSGVPPGLTLDAAGTLSGVPSQQGRFSMRARTVDAAGCPEETLHQVRVCAAVAIQPATMPRALQLRPYGVTLVATGGTPPYSFSILSGALPPDVQLSGARLAGTPQMAGSFPFTLRATDANACTGLLAATIDVCPALEIEPVALAPSMVGSAYVATITAAPGSHTLSVTAGSLPAGLSLSAGGVISGVPTSAGSVTFEVTAIDAAGCSDRKSYALVVNAASCPTVTLTPATLPAPTFGAPYSQTIMASGGTPPYGFALASGVLPNGLSLSAAGVLSGTPVDVGLFRIAVTSTDAVGCVGLGLYDLPLGVDIVVGAGHGPANPNRVKVIVGAGVATPADFFAYGAGTWGVNVSTGQMDAGPDEILTGPGPGPVHGPTVRAFRRDATAMAKINFFAYGTLRYGVNVAGARLDADPFGEILSGAGSGAVFGPHVRGWNYDATAVSPINKVNFFAYATLHYGVEVGAGDVEADGYDELLTIPGPGQPFAPRVRAFDFDGATLAAIAKISFWALPILQFGGVVAAGDVEGDGFDEIVAAGGPGPTIPGRARGFDYDGTAIAALPGYDVTPFTSHYGARVALGDVGAVRRDGLLIAEGPDPGAFSGAIIYRYDAVGGTLSGAFGFARVFPPGYGMTVATGDLGY